MPTANKVLGIDPGSRITGYGVIEPLQGRLVYVTSGCIKSSAGELPERLGSIFVGISEIIEAYQPRTVAIEQVFVARNPGTALKLGQARGAAIAAAVVAGLPVAEYAARAVKRAVTGTGAAEKSQIQHMVRVLLALPGVPAEDAADALAIAICHVNTAGLD